jgi:hypothetical protein
VNSFLRSALGFNRLPEEKRVAVMPLECRGEPPAALVLRACWYIVGKLGEQDRFQIKGGIQWCPPSTS